MPELNVSYDDLNRENAALQAELSQCKGLAERCRSVEERLRISEERLRRAADSADAVVYDFDLRPGGQRILHGMERVTGIKPDEVRFTLEWWRSRLHPQDAPAYLAALERQLRTGGVVKSIFRILHASGEWLDVESSREVILDRDGSPIRLVGVFVNVTQRAAAEAALRESEARYRILADTMPQVVFTASACGLMEYVNQPGLNYMGLPLHEATGLGWLAAIHDDDRQAVADRWLECMRLGKPYEFEYRMLRADGEYRWQLARAVPITDESGGIVRWIGTSTDIHDRKQAEEASRRNEELLRLVTDSSPIATTYCDAEQRFLFVNRAYAERFDLSPEQVIGKRIVEVVGEQAFASFRTYVERALSGTRSDFEVTVHYDRIGTRYMRCAYVPHVNEQGGGIGFTAVMVDMTDRRRTEDALLESEERLRLALEAGQMGAWDVDLVSDSTRWDAKEFELLGLPPDSAAPSPAEFYALVHPDDRPLVRQAVQRAVDEAGALEHEFRIVLPDGHIRWLASKGRILKDNHGKPVRMIGVNFDVTERKRTEVGLRASAEELETRVGERTRELVNLHGRLRALATDLHLTEQRERKRLATDLHDYLAQLLALVRMKLGQMKRLAPPPAQEDLVEQTEAVVNEALTYTRTLVAQLSPPVLHEFGLPIALKWLAEQMVRQELSVEVRQSVSDRIPLPEDQAVLLFQSVRELLINVQKHALTHHAVVTIDQQGDELRLTVRDEGAGMEQTGSVSFDQPSPTSSKFGLFSIRERMLAIGGRLVVESAPGRGMTATLTLPFGGAAAAEPLSVMRHGLSVETQTQEIARPGTSEHALRITHHASRQQHTNVIRVLLVDDHPMVRKGLKGLLGGYTDIAIIGEAWDGEEAIAFVDKLRPDCVIMDINMPKIDGIEATRRIKAAFSTVAVVGLSVNTSKEVDDAMRRAGADDFLSKGAPADAIHRAILSAARKD